MYRRTEKRGRTSGGGGNDVTHGVLSVEHQPGFIVRMSGVKVREGHVDATHPYLPNQGIHVQNHTHVNRDGGGGGGVSRLSRHSDRQPNIDEETGSDE
ncbi:hypothetical protein V6N13_107533 [Hibiscus sabdariffa]